VIVPKRIAVLLVSCLVIVACQALPFDGVVPASEMILTVANETSIPVELVVNGQVIRTIGPTTSVDVHASNLPTLPWAAEVRLPAGRTLVSASIHAGDVWSRPVANGGTEMKGVGGRVDLSCGRIDIYSGPPLLGPAPGPGTPGDCDP